ncbi:MAG: T9SS type A sorting domain-containing protein [Ginsengibacter sp.]
MKLFLRSLLLTFFAVTLSSVNVFSQSATIQTDHLDYPPGSTVIITGTGWLAGETVTLQVLHVGETGDNATSGAHAPFTAIADDNGNVSSSWTVPYDEDELGATLLLTAIGGSSGLNAEWTFTDALPNMTTNPLSGSTLGGYTIKLTSSNAFNTGQAPYTVIIDGQSVAGTRIDNNNLSFTAPAHISGTVSIVVDGKNGPVTNSTNFTYNKATQTISFNNPGTKTYGDADFNLGATASSGLPVTYSVTTSPATIVSGNMLHITGAGTVTVKAAQSGNETYAAAADVTQTFTVNKANAIISVTGTSTFTYNGTPQGPSTINYNGDGTTTLLYTNVDGASYSSATPPINSGNYMVVASATAGTNYNSANSEPYTFAIEKAFSSITATGTISFIYNGLAQGPASSTVTGSSGTVTYNYSGTSNAGVLYGPSVTAPILAGSYFVTAAVAQDDNFKSASSEPLNITIDKASSVTTVTINGGPFTYTGSGITPASVSVTGAGGLSLTPDAVYENNINAGTAKASYTYAGDENHEASQDSKTFTIDKASSVTTVTINGGPFTYTGSGITPASVSVTGAGGLSLTPDAVYENNINAGTAKASYTYAGDENHEASQGSKDYVIGKANALVNVTGYTGTYDAVSHGATASVTGVDANGTATGTTLNLGSSFKDVPGGTANWTFSGGPNYNDQSGNVLIVINKADATVTVTGFSGTYDGNTHSASGFAYGVGGINDVLSPAIIFSYSGTIGANNTAYGPTVDAPYQAGNYSVSGSFAGNNNYNNASKTASITINNIAISGSASTGKINCNGETTTLTAAATGGDGTLQYSLNGGTYQSSNQFTVSASSNPYNVTVKDQDGFTYVMNSVYVSEPALLVTTASTSNPRLYFGAPGDQTATISANVSGGTAPYVVSVSMDRLMIFGSINTTGNESWNGLAGTSKNNTAPATSVPVTIITNVSSGTINLVNVTLLKDAVFTVTVIDANGCTQTSTVKVIAEDARCFAGKSPIVKVSMCHLTGSAKNPSTQICVDENAVQAHLKDGDFLGSCSVKSRIMNPTASEVKPPVPQEELPGKLSINVMPNPTSYYFTLILKSLSKENVRLTVTDITGRLIEQKTGVPANSTLQLGNQYHPGIYIAEFMQGNDRVTLRLIKEGK